MSTAGAQCNDVCGFLAAFIGSICYGTYAVPLKLTAKLDCHPLVLQTYKTVICFCLSWTVLLFEPDLRWTPYGIIAGFLWVTGGSLGCAAILYAGIATAVGTWASVMIFVNFVWGILVFHEPVNSLTGTIGAFCFLSLGLIGMTKFASPTRGPSSSLPASKTTDDDEDDDNDNNIDDDRIELLPMVVEKPDKQRRLVSRNLSSVGATKDEEDNDHGTNKDTEADFDNDMDDKNDDNNVGNNDDDDVVLGKSLGGPVVHVLGYAITRRQAGVGCAIMNGLLTGSSLVPLHYAKQDGIDGMSYFVSFSSGAIIANCCIWMMYFLLQCVKTGGDVSKAWDQIPRFYFSQIWLKMIVAGTLLSGGQLGAILATSSLGQAVGNSLIQSKILISGVWGLCVFKEVKDRRAITRWFFSALVTVCGILWLSYERRTISPEPMDIHKT